MVNQPQFIVKETYILSKEKTKDTKKPKNIQIYNFFKKYIIANFLFTLLTSIKKHANNKTKKQYI